VSHRTKVIFTLAILAMAAMLMACSAGYAWQSDSDMHRDIQHHIDVTMTARPQW
jgi:ABC-type glycerol-3-phosphate transport system substrate-binding protein